MEAATRLLTDLTGCSDAKAQAVISALIAEGWSPPSPKQPPEPVSEQPQLGASLENLGAGAVLVAHTDGACSGNPGPGGWGVVFSCGDRVIAEFSGSDAATTNNRMELKAALEAVKRAPVRVTLEINTDSKNVVGWLQDGWKRNDANIRLLAQEFDDLRVKRGQEHGGRITFRYVRGHNGDPLNERADRLATGAIRAV